MAKRNNLMNEIENNLQKADNFNQVIQPTGKLKRDENEALQYMQHQRAQTQAELEMQKRLKMMEEIEANPEKGDKFNRIVKPSDLKNNEAEAMAYMKDAKKTAQVDLAMEQRLKMMEEVEAHPEKGDDFNRIVKPTDLKNNEAEAIQFMKQSKVEAQTDLAMQKRLDMMNQIEADPEGDNDPTSKVKHPWADAAKPKSSMQSLQTRLGK